MFQLYKYNIWKTTLSAIDKANYSQAKDYYKRILKTAKAKWAAGKISQANNKSKATWDVINKLQSKPSSGSDNISLNWEGKIIKNPNTICSIFNSYFAEVADQIKTSLLKNNSQQNRISIGQNQRNRFSSFSKINEINGTSNWHKLSHVSNIVM